MRIDEANSELPARFGPSPDDEDAVPVAHTMLSGVREVLTLAQLGEFVDCHHTVDLFRLETLPIYNADSDDDGPWWAARPADHRDTEAG